MEKKREFDKLTEVLLQLELIEKQIKIMEGLTNER